MSSPFGDEDGKEDDGGQDDQGNQLAQVDPPLGKERGMFGEFRGDKVPDNGGEEEDHQDCTDHREDDQVLNQGESGLAFSHCSLLFVRENTMILSLSPKVKIGYQKIARPEQFR